MVDREKKKCMDCGVSFSTRRSDRTMCNQCSRKFALANNKKKMCVECHRSFGTMGYEGDVCPSCKRMGDDHPLKKQKRELFKKLDAMSVEERLRRMEERTFDPFIDR